jgi:hypothetical protein
MKRKKICRKCKEYLSFDNYYKDKCSPNGYRSKCKKCHSVSYQLRKRQKQLPEISTHNFWVIQ